MSGSPSGVIHDIGYRHYDGERLGRAAVVRSLYVSTLRSTFGIGRTAKSKIMPFILAGCMLLPALVLEIVLFFGRSLPPAEVLFEQQVMPYTNYVLVAQAAVAIYLAAIAPQVFSRDLRFRTVALYFARPLRRVDYVMARFLGLASGLAILCLAPLLLMFVGGLLAGLPFGQELRGFAEAGFGVLFLSLMLAGLGGLIASATVRRGIAVAVIVTVTTMTMAVASLVAALGSFQNNDTAAGLGALLSPFTLLDAIQTVLFDANAGLTEVPDGAGWTLLYPTFGVLLVIGLFGLILARYRKVTGA